MFRNAQQNMYLSHDCISNWFVLSWVQTSLHWATLSTIITALHVGDVHHLAEHCCSLKTINFQMLKKNDVLLLRVQCSARYSRHIYAYRRLNAQNHYIAYSAITAAGGQRSFSSGRARRTPAHPHTNHSVYTDISERTGNDYNIYAEESGENGSRRPKAVGAAGEAS